MRSRKNLVCCFLAALVLILAATTVEARTLNVALVIDGNGNLNNDLIINIGQELEKLLGEDDKILFPPEMKVYCEWDKTKIDSAISQAMKDKRSDAVLCIGPVSSNLICKLEKLPKPSFASQILNAEIQTIKKESGKSARKNLNFIDLGIDFAANLDRFQEIRRFKKLGFVAGSYIHEGIPQIFSYLKEIGKKTDFELVNISADEFANRGVIDLQKADAVYVAPLPELPASTIEKMAKSINEQKVPSMNMIGSAELASGLMASVANNPDSEKLARRIALNLQRLLFDEDPADFDTAFSYSERLHLNMKTARQIGVYPTWQQMTDAVIINSEPQDLERKLSLTQVLETAVINNLQLAAKRQEINAGKHGVDRAKSNLRPKVSLFGRENVIDIDRAESIMSPAQYQTQIGTDLMQVIFSEQARANIDIQKLMLAAKKEEERALILDTMRDAAIAYLNVLKAMTLQAIQKDNLEVTIANLEIAKFREQVGTSGPAEVYRWEIQLASSRQAIIDASVMRKKTELALNQALSLSQEEEFTTADCDIFAKVFLLDQVQVAPYIDNMYSYKVFRDFLVNDTFAFSPEIQQIEKNISAQKRAHLSAKRRFNQPTVALQGNFTRTLKESGVGEPKPALPAPFGSMFKYPDKNDWYVGLNVSIPLHEGGDRPAAVKQAAATINQLENTLEFLKQRLELNTRATLEDARSSYSSIGLSNTRAEYAAKALDLVQNAYSRGAVNILDLIDAQNALLVAKEASANSMFNFFSDFVRVSRAVGSFEFILDKDSHAKWNERLQQYFKANAVKATFDRKPVAEKPMIKSLQEEKILYEENR